MLQQQSQMYNRLMYFVGIFTLKIEEKNYQYFTEPTEWKVTPFIHSDTTRSDC